MPAQTPNRRVVGLLGGSFNPPHAGHREISLAALERLKLDEVWWLITPGNPLKDPDTYAPINDRIDMARTVSDHPNILISDFEHTHNLQYTIDTLNKLQALHTEIQFIWIMGADSLANFHLWKDWREIAKLVPIAVFNRPKYGQMALSSIAAKELSSCRIDDSAPETLPHTSAPAWVFFTDTNNPLSSTKIRNNDKNPEENNTNMTDLTAPHGPLAYYLDLHPDLGDFRTDVIEGLSLDQKTLSPKYFYDAHGSKIFDQITQLDEYYPTRTEKQIFADNAEAITAAIGSNTAIFEYGSGSSEKIEWLINGLEKPVAYVAMDISKTHLIESASVLTETLSLPIAAVCADFHAPINLPKEILPPADRWLGFFPGSTLGNMEPESAVKFMTRASDTLGPNAKFLLGVDLEKEISVILNAYNDKEGVTAAFNLNLLHRMKNELGASLTIEDFVHDAIYNTDLRRIEMHLRAIKPTTIRVNDHDFSFAEGETLHTESSHKFSIPRLEALFNQTPWQLDEVWTDKKGWFAACLLSNR